MSTWSIFLTCYKTNAVSSGVKCGKYEYSCLKIYLVLNIESAANNQIKVPINEIGGSGKKKKRRNGFIFSLWVYLLITHPKVILSKYCIWFCPGGVGLSSATSFASYRNVTWQAENVIWAGRVLYRNWWVLFPRGCWVDRTAKGDLPSFLLMFSVIRKGTCWTSVKMKNRTSSAHVQSIH